MDLIEKNSNTAKEFSGYIRTACTFTDVPIIFTSVLQKQRIHKTLESVMEVYSNRQRKIPASRLNEVMLEAIGAYPPPSEKESILKSNIGHCDPTPAFAFLQSAPIN
jgi:GTP-binding protein